MVQFLKLSDRNAKPLNEISVDIRVASAADYSILGELMYDAVRNGPSEYNEAQRRAWVPINRSGFEWNSRLASQFVVVAELRRFEIGFMSLGSDGYVDFAYIRPGYRGRGVFRKLYKQIELESERQNLERLWVQASLNAKGAFQSVGFSVTQEESVTIGSVSLPRFEMEKMLVE